MCEDPLACMICRAMVLDMLAETAGLEMMRDRYGNHVVQKTLEVSLSKGCSASHQGYLTLTTGYFSPKRAVGNALPPSKNAACPALHITPLQVPWAVIFKIHRN